MNPVVSWIGGGKSPALSSRILDLSRALPAPESLEPKETFQSGLPQAPSQETVAQPVTAPALETLQKPGQAAPARAESRLTGPLLQELPSPAEAAQGFTFGQLISSATAAVGKTVRRWLLDDPLLELNKDLARINELESSARLLKTPEQFAAKTAELKQRLADGASLDDIRDEAYAVAREAALQTSNMRAFDCQMLGALAMNDGYVAQMRTGEGKTLTAVMPLYLNALAGKGAHLVTVNETLAKRDSEWMGPVFERLGMKVGLVLDEQTPEQKRAGYQCDVTYLTDRTLGFDYLHDQTAHDTAQRLQRGHFFALVDEVDDVMIDEARTPMILSVQGKAASPDYKMFAEIVKDLVPGQDYQTDPQQTAVWLTDGGLRMVENELTLKEARREHPLCRPDSPKALEVEARIDQCLARRQLLRDENKARKAFEDEDAKKPNMVARLVGFSGDYDAARAEQLQAQWEQTRSAREAAPGATIDLYADGNFPRVHPLDACLKAQVLQVPGKHYAVEDGEIKIIDQNKGRVSDGKRFSQGLHQALEAKEGLEVRAESRTAASITLPELFQLYDRKSGMTGTGKTSEGDFQHFYDLSVVEIPTNKPVIRVDQPDLVFSTQAEKLSAVVEEAVKSARGGRPVLIGTLSVNANKAVAARLLEAGFPADRLQVLNAETARSSEDVYEDNAGLSGTITLATGERADNVVADPLNFKKMALLCQQALEQGRGVVVDVDNAQDAQQLQAWVSRFGPAEVVQTAAASAPAGQVLIRVAAPGATEPGSTLIQASEHRVEKLVLDVDPAHLEGTLESALAAYQEGRPVVLRCKSSHGLSVSAERLLDAGLGLESLPLVCDGKEKENLLIERAGRAGFITVATNMAGRGADIKPDAFDYDELSEQAYQAAQSAPSGVVLDFEKDSQALKVMRRLAPHCSVALAETPHQQPVPGQVLLRFGKELPALGSAVRHIDTAKHQTHGLYVIGTERSNSRRIDDQLIGRAGRQGAEGESRFFLSVEDDLLRLSPGHGLEGLVKAMGGGKSGVSSPIVNQQLAEVQRQGEVEQSESRRKSDKLEEVMRTQREAYFRFRDEIAQSKGDSLTKDYIADFAASALTEALQEGLGEQRRYEASRVREEALRLSQSLGLPLELEFGAELLEPEQVESAVHAALSKAISASPLPAEDWRAAFLYTADQSWQTQLEDMEALRDAVQLETVGGRKPEEAYALRGFATYEEMVGNLKQAVGTHLLPLLLRKESA